MEKLITEHPEAVIWFFGVLGAIWIVLAAFLSFLLKRVLWPRIDSQNSVTKAECKAHRDQMESGCDECRARIDERCNGFKDRMERDFHVGDGRMNDIADGVAVMIQGQLLMCSAIPELDCKELQANAKESIGKLVRHVRS